MGTSFLLNSCRLKSVRLCFNSVCDSRDCQFRPLMKQLWAGAILRDPVFSCRTSLRYKRRVVGNMMSHSHLFFLLGWSRNKLTLCFLPSRLLLESGFTRQQSLPYFALCYGSYHTPHLPDWLTCIFLHFVHPSLSSRPHQTRIFSDLSFSEDLRRSAP